MSILSLPNSLTFEQANQESVHFLEIVDILDRINILCEGGYKLERRLNEFLPQRPGELPELYKNRLSKYTSRQILGESLKQQVSRLANGFIALSGYPEADKGFWQRFRANTNGNNKGRSERELIALIFSNLLKYREVFIQVEKPKADVQPRNRAEEAALGDPYIVIHTPLSVINYEENNGKLEWVKLRSVEIKNDPFSEPTYIAKWTIIDDQQIAVYSAPVELDDQGKILGIKSFNNQSPSTEQVVSLAAPITYHGLPAIPVFKVQLKEEQWVANAAYAKSYEHLRLDCHKFDLLTYASFQRFYTKEPPTPDSNIPKQLQETYVDAEESTQVGLEHVLKLQNFAYAEPKGDIIDKLNSTLERIEHEVEQLVDLTGATATQDGKVQQQSGYAREFDFISQQESLEAYGQVLARALQTAYQLVNQFRGQPYPIYVSGLDSFEVDDQGTLIASLQAITALDFATLQAKLPPTLFASLYSRLCLLLAHNLSPESLSQLQSEASEQTFS